MFKVDKLPSPDSPLTCDCDQCPCYECRMETRANQAQGEPPACPGCQDTGVPPVPMVEVA